jgi:acetylornithine deacetylase
LSTDIVLGHLRELVGFDTQNPPRLIDGDAELFAYCKAAIGGGYTVQTWDHGDGHVSWLAQRGRPNILFNVHLDTVPSGEGWSHDPLQLTVRDGRAYGRGSCDIKGAAAALLALAPQAENLALLFTTDEEGAGGCCVDRFLQDGHGEAFHQVVVAEPTACRAVLGHRGYLSVKTWFRGEPGHSSEPRALEGSANHRMSAWAVGALHVARARKNDAQDPGACFNIGLVEGGSKSNVIAGECFVHWSARLRPGESNEDFLREVQECADEDTEWLVPFTGEPLPAAGRDDSAATAFCEHHGLPVAAPVDFWTEAALFSAAGFPALVLGPGHIEQAHVTDEWVSLAQLEKIHGMYAKLVTSDG